MVLFCKRLYRLMVFATEVIDIFFHEKKRFELKNRADFFSAAGEEFKDDWGKSWLWKTAFFWLPLLDVIWDLLVLLLLPPSSAFPFVSSCWDVSLMFRNGLNRVSVRPVFRARPHNPADLNGDTATSVLGPCDPVRPFFRAGPQLLCHNISQQGCRNDVWSF